MTLRSIIRLLSIIKTAFIAKRIGAMYQSKNLLPLKYRRMFANLPYFDYLDIIWNKTYQTNLNELSWNDQMKYAENKLMSTIV